MVGRALVSWSVERVMEATGQTGVMLLRPCGSEAGYAEGKRATGDGEPRSLRRYFGSLSLIISVVLHFRIRVNGSECIAVDGLAFEIGLVRSMCDLGCGESREVEPRNIRDG